MFAGIDIGTTAVKISVYGNNGEELARSSCGYPRRQLHAIPADSMWNAVGSCLAELEEALGVHRKIDALAISTFGESVAAVDREGRALSDFILRTCPDGDRELREILHQVPEREIHQITGLFPDKRFPLIRMKRYRENTDVYQKAYKFLTVEAYIIYMLTGSFFTSESTAWRTMAYDIHHRAWSEQLLVAAGLDAGKLPEVLPSGSFCGVCRPRGASQLLSGTRVYTGGHDQLCNAVGSGLREGSALNCSGTVECLSLVTSGLGDEKTFRQKLQQIPYPAQAGKHFSFWAPVAGCSSLDWCLRLLCSDRYSEAARPALHAEIQRRCCRTPTGLLVAPYFNGRGFPDFSSTASGLVKGLRLDTTPADLYQAVMESIAFEIKLCLESPPPQTGNGRDTRIFASGGGANSAYWLQMKADIYGRSVVRFRHREAGTMGAMLLAAVGEGYYDSFDAAFHACIREQDIYTSDPELSQRYQEKYLRYLIFRKEIEAQGEAYCDAKQP